jgi:hypothetical protein
MGDLRICILIFVTFCCTTVLHLNVKAQSSSKNTLPGEHFIGNRSFIVFPEYREKPIKWYDTLSDEKIKNLHHQEAFIMDAQPGEYYIYQLGVKALKLNLADVQIAFSDLKGENGRSIKAAKMTCFNKGGVDFKGLPFQKRINIPVNRIQALWISIDLTGVKKGKYTGSVAVITHGEKRAVPLLLNVAGAAVPDHGFNEGARLARLNWLNSTVGISEEITNGYIPVKTEGNKVNILGRTLTIADNGLPASILSYFGPSNQSLTENGESIVNQPFRFIIEKENGDIVKLIPGKLTFTTQTPSKTVWQVINSSPEFELTCTGQMEFDGFVDFGLKLRAKAAVKVKDIRLEIPIVKEKAEYMMGLGQEGGVRIPELNWKWDVSKNQDMLWLGAVNGGLRVKWKAENYVRPLVNIYYGFSPLKMPPSWENNGLGGVNVARQNSDVVINAYSGKRALNNGEVLNYDFELLITPFKLIDKNIKFDDRYYQGGGRNSSVKIADAKKAGANIITIHQADDIYPFINYPYLDENSNQISKMAADAHNANMRLKLYYTTRELTKNLPEFWALNSLNGEVIFPGPGNAARTEALHPKGPGKWLIDNVREKYIPAWYDTIKYGKHKGEVDLSVITTPDSRLNNFYIAGLNWMVQNMGIDGVYIDDSALDRFTLRRARKIIDAYRPQGRIDMHSWNHFHKWAGYASCLNLYMDLLPYLDLVWIGEARNYDRLPDHWLIEVSGIPFGLPGQMLEGGGNPWRGMIYGITTRAGWTINPPTEIWRFWDEHHIKDKTMIGYWEKDCPINCNNPLIKATVYKGKDETIIALANWSADEQQVALDVDWSKLGADPDRSEVYIPEIKDFQAGQKPVSLGKIMIPGKKGFLILLKNKN